MMTLEMDTDFAGYEIVYLREVKNGKVRCGGRFSGIESMEFEYIASAWRVN